ncbi:unnamed protein product [Mytilus edulis]|uniref:Uncharacterized protein n=1 Tax=Mytilus edulis TaxID=6550 RepID=A0A8S3QQX1_MYTED|nr:unnamed protein product [Mytilus edulis]
MGQTLTESITEPSKALALTAGETSSNIRALPSSSCTVPSKTLAIAPSTFLPLPNITTASTTLMSTERSSVTYNVGQKTLYTSAKEHKAPPLPFSGPLPCLQLHNRTILFIKKNDFIFRRRTNLIISYYGVNCTDTCPERCYKIIVIQKGFCNVCKRSFYGDHCEKNCHSNCREGSFCDQQTGECTIACTAGFWGKSCEDNCNDRCESCDRTHDICSTYSCKPGYGGSNCQLNCIAHCDSCSENDTCNKYSKGWFGNKCELQCPVNCRNSACSKFHGSCTCSKGFKEHAKETALSIGLVAGIAIGCAAAVMLMIGLVYFIHRHRSNVDNTIKMKNIQYGTVK